MVALEQPQLHPQVKLAIDFLSVLNILFLFRKSMFEPPVE